MQVLPDRVRPPVRVLFVGINPGIRSATIGHHFAGYSNRFWELLYEARLVSEPIGPEDDVRLPEWGLGITNLISRATPGIDTLSRQEYADGERVLRRKVRRLKPDIVALVGVTLFRALFEKGTGVFFQPRRDAGEKKGTGLIFTGQMPRETCQKRGLKGSRKMRPVPFSFEGARLFVLPNPSGRNANFSYAEMLAVFRDLARQVRR